ncbi:ATP-binding cassette domain-containing protein [Levilactobacillus brevis]|uniref:ATP-binding cassette domain-containing protein n=1 Tax=Levilactobacillus brevis TaxID=1580 RepID=UPI001EF3C712|nr:ATP-binding cassette domain-containing protein [Levilactobacillus brevis]
MQPSTAITVSHLSKTFGVKTVVDDLSFAVKPGEVFGLLGPNGAGKTTTLRMMTTLLKATSGTVTIFGHDVRKESRLARAMFGLTGQYASIDVHAPLRWGNRWRGASLSTHHCPRNSDSNSPVGCVRIWRPDSRGLGLRGL